MDSGELKSLGNEEVGRWQQKGQWEVCVCADSYFFKGVLTCISYMYIYDSLINCILPEDCKLRLARDHAFLF